ncbi:MAG: hypothetical protein N2V78_03555 [Methanophagales archaeon]|nr:hypothetical protein [Methanophagales archaeon]
MKMKRGIAILGVAGLVLLITSMSYASATTSINGPFMQGKVPPFAETPLPQDSPFVVNVTTNRTVASAHINVTFPPELLLTTVHPDPLGSFDFAMSRNGTGWVDVIVAEASGLPTGYPVAPLLAEIGFLTTVNGTYTINLMSTINGVVDDVVNLSITVIAVPGDVNGDGIVNYWDIVEVIEHWGSTDPKYDVDRSGTADYGDINFIVEHWTGP